MNEIPAIDRDWLSLLRQLASRLRSADSALCHTDLVAARAVKVGNKDRSRQERDPASAFYEAAYTQKKPHSNELCGTSEMRSRVKPDKKPNL